MARLPFQPSIGDHTVELRKERFKPRQFKKHFAAGGTISLAAADAALEVASCGRIENYLRARRRHGRNRERWAAENGEQWRAAQSCRRNLHAYCANRRKVHAHVYARSHRGQTKTLDLSLAPNGMSKWDDPGSWKHEGDAFTRKGGDFVLYGVPASGTFVFSAMLTKGHLLQWVLNYSDPKNYVLFQMDDNNFYRTVIRNGEKTDEIIVPDKGDKKSFRTLQIRVSPTELVHQIKHGDHWTVLDRWTQPRTNLSLGKFGFYIPGNDQVALSNFAHYVDLNIR